VHPFEPTDRIVKGGAVFGLAVEVEMTRITVDDLLSKALHQLHEPVELCDGSGHTLGQFLPSNALPLVKASDNCPYTEQELEEMRKDRDGCRTLAEVWKELGQA
jgi:hypothetical protein